MDFVNAEVSQKNFYITLHERVFSPQNKVDENKELFN